MSFDLIVIGAGTAGMPCAIEAAKRGKKVLVIEKSNQAGGTLHISGGHMSAAGTNEQKQKNIADSIEEHYDDVMEISSNSADADLVKLAVNEAPNTIEWLAENDFEFAPESPRLVMGHVPYKKPRTHYSTAAGKGILKTMLPLWNEQIEKGNIVCLFEHSLNKINIDNEEVTSIECTDIHNKIKVFPEPNQPKIPIVIATGGYGGNPELFAQKHPDLPPLKSSTSDLSKGDGIMLAEQAGAATWGFDKHIGSLGGVELIPDSGKVDFWTAWAMVLTSFYRPTREIYVNIEGKRFMDEGEFNADTRERIVAKQPQQAFYIVFDEAALNSEGISIMLNWSKEKIKEEAQNQKAICTAENIQDLAKLTNLPIENLKKTIEDFNQSVDNQLDTEFGRTDLPNKIIQPPFYAIKSYVSVLLTFGGIKVNKNLQVVNQENHPIKNLYAIGETIGMAATSGNAFCSGMAVTPALSFGRVLGRRL
jgi:flavocytochrome c